ncbi:MAG: flavin reductase family protein [Acidilobus sp.]
MARLVRLESMEGFYRTLHPSLTVVLITGCPNGRINTMPASWNMPVAEDPPSVAVSVYREAYTFQCLEYRPEATINVPDLTMADVVYAMGSVSGRDVDKVSRFRLRLEPSERVSVPRWSDAVASLEARVSGRMDVGESRVYAFEVLAVYVRGGVYTRWGYDFTKVNLLLHGSGRTFYEVGRQVRARPAL